MNATYGIGDIGMAAFSVFFMQSPSFLAHQRQLEEGHGRSNCASLFSIAKNPSDNHIRDMLDPAAPALPRPVFAETIEQLRQIDGGLDMFRRLDGRVLIALDGSEYHCSRKIHCRHCTTRVRGNGGTEYFHSILAATLVAPGHDKVIPLEPEFLVPQDGAEKQDCENMAAKRWLAAHAQRYAALDPQFRGGPLRIGDGRSGRSRRGALPTTWPRADRQPGQNLYGAFGVKRILWSASSFCSGSIAPVAARWRACDERVEVSIDNGLKGVGSGTPAQALGQRIMPFSRLA